MWRLLFLFIFIAMVPVFVHAAEGVNKFELTSPALKQDGDLPSKYTCLSGDINPPFEMKNVPAKTESMALTMHDPDVPEGIWVHWVLYNIPPKKKIILENSVPGYQALNDFGRYNYGSPCPADEKLHHYIYHAYALDIILTINEGMTMKDLERVMAGHILGESKLTALYRKPIW